MHYYFFIRYGMVPVAMFGYIAYQLIVKKKAFAEITNDLLACIFFAGVYYGLYILFIG